MRKPGKFFISIVPFLIAMALQFVITIPMEIIYIIRKASISGESLEDIINTVVSTGTDPSFSQSVNLVYGILAVIIFCTWYRKVFVKPFQHKKKENHPTGFSFHTIMAILCLSIGLQYVTTFVVNIAASIHPAWLDIYETLMDTAGFYEFSPVIFVYTVILAPIAEETIFRGLIFRYSRYALPFWFANIWQALLFGVMHMNFLQGLYAFIMGLFLGFICHRGRGIKYSIPVHMLFNLIGYCYSDLIGLTTALNYTLFTILGILLTIFAVWLFYTDFTPAKTKQYDDYNE